MMIDLPEWLSIAWAVAGCCTFLGGACWIVFIFWPALREQLSFIRESRSEIQRSIKDRAEMVEALKDLKRLGHEVEDSVERAGKVIISAEKIVEELRSVDWTESIETTRAVYSRVREVIEKLNDPYNKRKAQELWARVSNVAGRLYRTVGNGRTP